MATPADNQPPVPQATTAEPPPKAAGLRSIGDRWMMADVETRARVLLRALACVFSLLSLIVMASNKHGGDEDFDQYPEYNYCLAAAIIAFLYSSGQIVRDICRICGAADAMPRKASAVIDFAGDQVVAYFLVSGLSAASPVTDYMRAKGRNAFIDASGAAISMEFFAFVTLALSTMLSGYRLSMEALA